MTIGTEGACFEQFWEGRSLDALLVDAALRAPDKIAVVADRVDREIAQRITYRELDLRVERCARAFKAIGVGENDIVTVQLPNWSEFVVIIFACARIGAIINPVMPILRERELTYVLNFCRSKVIVIPKIYRGFDYETMVRGIRVDCAKLERVVVVGGDDADSYANLVEKLPMEIGNRLPSLQKPGAVSVLMFTSGTTGTPKGVMHSANSLVACLRALATRFGLNADDVLLAASPMGHMTGFAAATLLACYLGGKIVLQDVWDPVRAITIAQREGVSYIPGATPFLVDICQSVTGGAPRPDRLRLFLCGGAPIPSVLVERAGSELGVAVCSLWGMTETLSATLTEPSRAVEKSPTTDGRPLEGMEVKIIDANGAVAPVNVTGPLLVRGAHMFSGYFKRPDIEPFDAEGWFDSGDLACRDEEGYIRISGRVKDVIIRGGENIPVVEIENLLYAHPAIAAVALVGYPDARLGERSCAFISPREGESVDLDTVRTYLAGCKVTKQFWPERVEIVGEMPRTASGKIQKFRLREMAKEFDANKVST